METLPLFIFAVVGVTYVITQSLIGRPLRKAVASLGGFFAALIYCPPCTGFWVGFGLSFTSLWLQPQLHVGGEWWWSATVAGWVGIACGGLWKEYGPQQDVWALDHAGDGDDNTSEEEDGKGS